MHLLIGGVAVGRRLGDELFHPLHDLFGIVLRLDNCFAVFLVDVDFGTGLDPEAFPYLLWQHDSALGIYRNYTPTVCGNIWMCFAALRHATLTRERILAKHL